MKEKCIHCGVNLEESIRKGNFCWASLKNFHEFPIVSPQDSIKEEKSACCGGIALIDFNKQCRICSICQKDFKPATPLQVKEKENETLNLLYTFNSKTNTWEVDVNGEKMTTKEFLDKYGQTIVPVKCCCGLKKCINDCAFDSSIHWDRENCGRIPKVSEKGGEECPKGADNSCGNCDVCKPKSWQERFVSKFFWKNDKGYYYPINSPELIHFQKSFISSEKLISEQEMLERIESRAKFCLKGTRKSWSVQRNLEAIKFDEGVGLVLQILSTLKPKQ